jgi:aspartokinase/homoserine dehydrogenase 1
VCGFSTIQNVAMLNVEGAGMLGVPGVAARLFGALERIKVNVSLIAQASSEQSICVAIRSDDAERAGAAVSECFRAELSLGHISDVTITSPCAIIAAVGDGMAHTSGVAGRFLSALGTAGVNVIGMSQGCSQRNISVIVSEADSAKALNSVHNAFCGLAHSPGGANISTQSFGLIESRIAGRATPTLRSPDGSVSPPPPGAAAANSPGAARWRTKAAGAQE